MGPNETNNCTCSNQSSSIVGKNMLTSISQQIKCI